MSMCPRDAGIYLHTKRSAIRSQAVSRDACWCRKCAPTDSVSLHMCSDHPERTLIQNMCLFISTCTGLNWSIYESGERRLTNCILKRYCTSLLNFHPWCLDNASAYKVFPKLSFYKNFLLGRHDRNGHNVLPDKQQYQDSNSGSQRGTGSGPKLFRANCIEVQITFGK